MQMILKYLFFLLVFCHVTYGAQDSLPVPQPTVKFDTATPLSPVVFDEEKIEQLKGEKAFNYLSKIENDSWWTRFKSWLGLKYQQLTDWLFGEYEANSIIAFLLMLLPYILIGIVIGLIIWLFIRLNPGPSLLGDPPAPGVYLHEDEKLVHNKDISALIEAAIRDKDYRLAVRYHYLQLLKMLHRKKFINYEFQKTDTEYLAELKDDTFRLPVKNVMRIYDFIWYGNFPLSEGEFEMAQNSFRSIKNSLNKITDEK